MKKWKNKINRRIFDKKVETARIVGNHWNMANNSIL